MTTFSVEVGGLLNDCTQEGQSNADRGRALERLVAAVFSAVPGVEVRATNAKSVFENEELDLLMGNLAVADGLSTVGPYFSVECKNWSRPVGSTEVSWFATKLRRSGQAFGVLVAARGITGSSHAMTAAHFEAAAALGEGQQVVVLTLAELGWLTSGRDLAELLKDKQARLIARREIHVCEERRTPSSRPPLRWQAESRQERDEALKEILDAPSHPARDCGPFKPDLEALGNAIERLFKSEESEPFGTHAVPLDGEDFNRWSDENEAAFDGVRDPLRRIAAHAVGDLQRRPGEIWDQKRLSLALDVYTPTNLPAEPGSALAQLLLAHWARIVDDGPGYSELWALLCLLDWSLEWLVGMETGRWPPPCV
jgi:hypothetical protein